MCSLGDSILARHISFTTHGRRTCLSRWRSLQLPMYSSIFGAADALRLLKSVQIHNELTFPLVFESREGFSPAWPWLFWCPPAQTRWRKTRGEKPASGHTPYVSWFLPSNEQQWELSGSHLISQIRRPNDIPAGNGWHRWPRPMNGPYSLVW